jgi:hypothetical protein
MQQVSPIPVREVASHHVDGAAQLLCLPDCICADQIAPLALGRSCQRLAIFFL